MSSIRWKKDVAGATRGISLLCVGIRGGIIRAFSDSKQRWDRGVYTGCNAVSAVIAFR